jgi:hypothetical protein
MTRYLLLLDTLLFLGRPLWRDDGSVFCICYWTSPAYSFCGPSPLELKTIFYSLRFETSLSSPPTTRRVTVELFEPASTRVKTPVASLVFKILVLNYFGYSGNLLIQPWNGPYRRPLRNLAARCREPSSCCCLAQATEKTKFLRYCCTLRSVYWALVWQCYDQMCYNDK